MSVLLFLAGAAGCSDAHSEHHCGSASCRCISEHQPPMWLVFDEAKASVVQQFLTTKYQWLDEFVTHITNIDLHHLKLYECRAGDGVHTHAAKCLGATVLKGANWELDHVGSRLTPPTGKDKEFQGQVWASLYGAKSHTSARRNIFTDLSLAFKHDRVSDSSKDGDAGDIWPISHSNIPDYEVTLIFNTDF